MSIEDKYQQLLRKYDTPFITAEQFLAANPIGISSERVLIEQIRAGKIKLRYTRLHSRKAKPIFYLWDVAVWQHANDPSITQPAADQAA